MGELQRQTAAEQSERMHSELSYKRLEAGSFTWPAVQNGAVTLSAAQLRLLFAGMDWTQMRPTTPISARPSVTLEKI